MRIAIIFALALSGCAGPPTGAWRGGVAPTSDARGEAGGEAAELSGRLAGATYGRVPGPAVSCVEVVDLRSNRALGGGLLLFEGDGGRQWVNRVQNCPALGYGRSVRLAAPVARLCRGGAVEVVDRGSNAALGTCALGDFLTYVPR